MRLVDVVYEGGAFWPQERVNLPEHTRFQIPVPDKQAETTGASQPIEDPDVAALFEVLAERYSEGVFM